ncbi:hypothetical protein BGE01nite_23430 [Brevifollis gellanilyticus]|uniref:Uncharacterized protein n=1 Tax=Brevifollis gellanilyticus TaxID=748831 RepID=A0A512M8K6_9BACT|nr:hypothetical protein BGE01nite_23430 [Brevifollis gellanilyticus]
MNGLTRQVLMPAIEVQKTGGLQALNKFFRQNGLACGTWQKGDLPSAIGLTNEHHRLGGGGCGRALHPSRVDTEPIQFLRDRKACHIVPTDIHKGCFAAQPGQNDECCGDRPSTHGDMIQGLVNPFSGLEIWDKPEIIQGGGADTDDIPQEAGTHVISRHEMRCGEGWLEIEAGMQHAHVSWESLASALPSCLKSKLPAIGKTAGRSQIEVLSSRHQDGERTRRAGGA